MKKKVLWFFLAVAVVISSLFVIHKVNKIRHNRGVTERGFWVDKNVKHFFDQPLADAIAEFLKKEGAQTVGDFGSGAQGYYTRYLIDKGFQSEGFDGNPYSPELSYGIVKVVDLSKPFDLKKQFDWVIALEVAEHIPKQYEAIFLQNLDRHAKNGIIITWAIVGQKGRGHVNCQNNDSVIKKMESFGYVYDEKEANKLRKSSSLSHFKNTVMVFYKKKS